MSRSSGRVVYHPGTKTEFDPEHMLLTVTTDQIEQMLAALMEETDAANSSFTAWDQEFVRSTNREYERKARNGYKEHPLNGRQLVWMCHLYRRLSDRVVRVLEKMESK
jgi:hypothetical protein